MLGLLEAISVTDEIGNVSALGHRLQIKCDDVG
jgi:hypothetical protein